ncbi:MAG TPA: hypothetical protein VFM54_22215, partial [Micromonosporaceae bacterium]|nr:hypothetical protein [Micromonosporaceae bacterium]
MARDGSAPPAGFVAFVARRAPGVRLAAHALTGNDRLAESFASELFSAVALRWARLRHGGDEATGGGADAYLDRI